MMNDAVSLPEGRTIHGSNSDKRNQELHSEKCEVTLSKARKCQNEALPLQPSLKHLLHAQCHMIRAKLAEPMH